MFFFVRYEEIQISKNKVAFKYIETSVCFAKKSKLDLNDLYLPAFSNVHIISLCMAMKTKKYSSVEELVEAALNVFWKSAFESMYNDNYGQDKILGNLSSWAEKTKKDPKWIPEHELNHVDITSRLPNFFP